MPDLICIKCELYQKVNGTITCTWKRGFQEVKHGTKASDGTLIRCDKMFPNEEDRITNRGW